MKKNILFLLILSFMMVSVWICHLLIYLYLIIALYLYFVRKKVRRLQNNFPTWETFNINLKRNYDFAIVGGDSAFKVVNKMPLKEGVIDWTLPGQSISIQFVVIKHFFGILKDCGHIFILLDENELISQDTKKILPFHRLIFHHWLFKNISFTKACFLSSPLWILKCYGIVISFGCRKNAKKSNLTINLDTLKCISNFLKERGILLEVVPLNIANDFVIEKIKEADVMIKSLEQFYRLIKS